MSTRWTSRVSSTISSTSLLVPSLSPLASHNLSRRCQSLHSSDISWRRSFATEAKATTSTTSTPATAATTSSTITETLQNNVPVLRPRLEEYLYSSMIEDMMVLLYRHDSPLAPTVADFEKEEQELASKSKSQTSDFFNVFATPFAHLPTNPLNPKGFTTSLISRRAARLNLGLPNRRWRRRLRNPIDYTTVTNKEFSDYYRGITKAYVEEKRAFERYFSPKLEHLPTIRKVVLRIWDEKAVANKSLILPALFCLESITGVQASPLFASVGDAAKKIRAGMPLGATVELTGPRAYEFLDKLTQIVLPKLREWKGVIPQGDGHGNIRLTIPESAVGGFPDIEPHFDMYPKLFDVDVTISTTAGTDEKAVLFLSGFQMPFTEKPEVVVVEEVNTDPWAKFKKRDKRDSKAAGNKPVKKKK
ncbi:hypothetical protein HDU76_013719 [Blyttiomyces sp. JEL0837]|nr:hypothetical protein HDU76_013719 [Blyttiomyces sp. JEL0837]